LDASTAYSLLLTLSRLAKRNRTIILSIHQPRSDAYNLFSRLVLLSKGSVIYSGHRDMCLPWFAHLDLHLQEETNVLDWMIDISSVDVRTPEKEEASRNQVLRLIEAWRTQGSSWGHESTLSKTPPVLKDHEKDVVNGISVQDAKSIMSVEKDADLSTTRRPGMFTQSIILLHRYVNGFAEVVWIFPIS
jgi:ABC-type multidrug transport system ATPase subunit